MSLLIILELEKYIKETAFYKQNSGRFSCAIYEIIPDDCNLTLVQGKKTNHGRIIFEGETKQKVLDWAGNQREYTHNIYSIVDNGMVGNELLYFHCDIDKVDNGFNL